MTPEEVLNRLSQVGVEPFIDRGRLRFRGNEERITPELADAVRRRRGKILRLLGATDTPETMGEFLEEYANRLEQGRQFEGYVWTGWKPLDAILRGTGPGYLTLIAARPKMGKSSFARQWAAYIAQKADVLLFSFEMDGLEVAQGHLSQQTRVTLRHHTPELARRLAKQHPRIHLYDRGRELETIERRVHNFCIQYPEAGAIVLDQLSHVTVKGLRDLREATTHVVKRCKSIAMDVGKPFILLHQIGRGAEKNVDKRPTIADLKETGACEEEANQVILLYRPAYHSGDESDRRVEVNVAAHRGGPTGMVQFEWEAPITRFDIPAKPLPDPTPPKPQRKQPAPPVQETWHDRQDNYPEDEYP